MVGQKILKEGRLDVKAPATSTIARGWRLSPWKTRQVKLMEVENGKVELQIFKKDFVYQVDAYQLTNITDITMIASKTHLHAFEIVANGKPVVVLSGATELDSRDWIWFLRKLFWSQPMAHTVKDTCKLQLLPNVDTRRAGLPSGIYEFNVSLVAISITLIRKCNSGGQSESTPVEPFREDNCRTSVSIPLTVIGRVQVEQQDERNRLVIEISPESDLGAGTFMFEQDCDIDLNILPGVLQNIKGVLFRATNSLHDCIASSRWRLDSET